MVTSSMRHTAHVGAGTGVRCRGQAGITCETCHLSQGSGEVSLIRTAFHDPGDPTLTLLVLSDSPHLLLQPSQTIFSTPLGTSLFQEEFCAREETHISFAYYLLLWNPSMQAKQSRVHPSHADSFRRLLGLCRVSFLPVKCSVLIG